MARFVAILVVLLAPAWMAAPAGAATLTVCPTGPPTCTHASIQAAVDASAACDTVQVAPGRYQEAVRVDRCLTLLGAPDAVVASFEATIPDPVTVPIVAPAAGSALLAAANVTVRGLVLLPAADGAPTVDAAGMLGMTSVRVHAATVGIRHRAPTSPAGGWTDSGSVDGALVVSAPGATAIAVDSGMYAATSTTIRGGSIGVAVGPGARYLASRAARTVDTQVAFRCAAACRIEQADIALPPGGTGVELSGASTLSEFAHSRVRASQPGVGVPPVGISATGTHDQLSVRTVHFHEVGPAFRADAAFASSGTFLATNRFATAQHQATIVSDSPAAIRAPNNWFGCAATPCGRVGGAGGGSVATEEDMRIRLFLAGGQLVPGSTPELGVDVSQPPAAGWTLQVGGEGAVPIELAVTSDFGVPMSMVGDSRTYFTAPVVVDRTAEAGRLRATMDGVTIEGDRAHTVRLPAVELIGSARIRGALVAGRRVRCVPPAFASDPDSVTYAWTYPGASGAAATGPSHVPSLLRGARVGCVVSVHRAHHWTATARVSARPIRPLVASASLRVEGARGRPLGCGASLRRACVVTSRGLRFRIGLPAAVAGTAVVRVERRSRRGWGVVLRGTVPVPAARRFYVPARLASRGTYRVHATLPTTAWTWPMATPYRYVRVR